MYSGIRRYRSVMGRDRSGLVVGSADLGLVASPAGEAAPSAGAAATRWPRGGRTSGQSSSLRETPGRPPPPHNKFLISFKKKFFHLSLCSAVICTYVYIFWMFIHFCHCVAIFRTTDRYKFCKKRRKSKFSQMDGYVRGTSTYFNWLHHHSEVPRI